MKLSDFFGDDLSKGDLAEIIARVLGDDDDGPDKTPKSWRDWLDKAYGNVRAGFGQPGDEDIPPEMIGHRLCNEVDPLLCSQRPAPGMPCNCPCHRIALASAIAFARRGIRAGTIRVSVDAPDYKREGMITHPGLLEVCLILMSAFPAGFTMRHDLDKHTVYIAVRAE